jgi:hypothetical protein
MNAYKDEEHQKDIEEVLEFKIQDEKLKFLIKWKNVRIFFFFTGS